MLKYLHKHPIKNKYVINKEDVSEYYFKEIKFDGSIIKHTNIFRWYHNDIPYTGFTYVQHTYYYYLIYYKDGYIRSMQELKSPPYFNPLAKALYE